MVACRHLVVLDGREPAVELDCSNIRTLAGLVWLEGLVSSQAPQRSKHHDSSTAADSLSSFVTARACDIVSFLSLPGLHDALLWLADSRYTDGNLKCSCTTSSILWVLFPSQLSIVAFERSMRMYCMYRSLISTMSSAFQET